MSRGLIVLGMHRSGTSCLAGMLQGAGFEAGKVQVWNADNDRGNREHLGVMALNEALLNDSGGSWDRPTAELEITERHRHRGRQILAELNDTGSPWMFKDPRSVWTLSFWRELAPETLTLGIFRHPLAVIRSLAHRDNTPPAIALNLWCCYNERLLACHDATPFPILVFDSSKDDFVLGATEALVSLFDDEVRNGHLDPAMLGAFYAENLVHNRGPVRRELGDLGELGEESESLHARAQALWEQLLDRCLHISDMGEEAGAAFQHELVAACELGRNTSDIDVVMASRGPGARVLKQAETSLGAEADTGAFIAWLERWLKRYPDNPQLRWHLAKACYQQGRLEDALAHASGCHNDCPGWLAPLRALVAWSAESGRLDESARADEQLGGMLREAESARRHIAHLVYDDGSGFSAHAGVEAVCRVVENSLKVEFQVPDAGHGSRRFRLDLGNQPAVLRGLACQAFDDNGRSREMVMGPDSALLHEADVFFFANACPRIELSLPDAEGFRITTIVLQAELVGIGRQALSLILQRLESALHVVLGPESENRDPGWIQQFLAGSRQLVHELLNAEVDTPADAGLALMMARQQKTELTALLDVRHALQASLRDAQQLTESLDRERVRLSGEVNSLKIARQRLEGELYNAQRLTEALDRERAGLVGKLQATHDEVARAAVLRRTVEASLSWRIASRLMRFMMSPLTLGLGHTGLDNWREATKSLEVAAVVRTDIPIPSQKASDTARDSLRVGSLSLKVLANIQCQTNGCLSATSDDPQLLVQLEQPLVPGFYLVKLRMDFPSGNTRYHARLYPSYGSGFKPENELTIVGKDKEDVARIVQFRDHVHELRFDPIEESAEFRLEKLDVSPVSVELASKEMKSAIANMDQQAIVEVHIEIDDLYQQYNDLVSRTQAAIEYHEWIDLVEKPSLPSPQECHRAVESFGWKPGFSIVIPTYNTDREYLKACIDSVLDQAYPYWELCIADDASTDEQIAQILEEYCQKDSRVRVVYREHNGHISAATNSALQLATGDFIALLDHDDELSPYALFYIAQDINQCPDAKIIYSDEDKIDTHGDRFDPHFKGDWNPDLFFSQNYVSHLGVYKTELVQQVGGFRVGVEGSQDHDLLLRCLPHVADHQIRHVPKVLYHWRAAVSSTASAASEKCYTTEAGVAALKAFFEESDQPAVRVSAGSLPNTYKISWPIPDPAPLVSLLIPTRDQKAVVEVAVSSILEKTTYPNYEIIILDNGSRDPQTLDYLQALAENHPNIRVLQYDKPFNFSAINNFGVTRAAGDLVGLINNDVEVISPDWLTEMVQHAIRPEIGCVGAKLYYADDTIQHAGVILGIGGVAGHSHKYFPRTSHGYFSRLKLVQNVSAVTGACLLIKKDLYERVGGLNEKDLAVAFNDIDFSLKIMATGYRNVWTPYAELYHHESISRGTEDTEEKVKRFNAEAEYMRQTWGTMLDNDPYYSPNLTLEHENFALGFR